MIRIHRLAALATLLIAHGASAAVRAPTTAPEFPLPSGIDIAPVPGPLAGACGIDGTERLLTRAHYDKRRGAYFSPLPSGDEAQLTLDPALQTKFEDILRASRLEAGAIVAMDPSTGRLLGVAELSRDGKPGAALNASYPAASVFKIVTAAALLEAGVNPNAETCFHGGFHRIQAKQLKDDPRRDGRCVSMGDAMGKSLNVVFGKLAAKDLDADKLRAMAGRFYFNQPLPIVPAPTGDQALVSPAFIPDDPLEFDRTAAGFGQVFLSPVHGAMMAGIIGNGGVSVAPRVIESVWSNGKPAPALKTHNQRVIAPATAGIIEQMMELTVSEGTAKKAFRQGRRPALGDVVVAGKTGTLADNAAGSKYREYSWFIGFAPANHPTIAISVVAVNGPKWTVRAPMVAREALEAHFSRDNERRRASR